MEKRILNAINKSSNGMTIGLLFFLYLFFALYILRNEEMKLTHAVGYNPVLDLNIYYTSDFVWETLNLLGEKLRREYAYIEMVVDPLYVIIYTLFFSFLNSYCIKKLKVKGSWKYFIFLPYFIGICDFIENGFILKMIFEFPAKTPRYAQVSSIFTAIKFTSFFVLLIVSLSLFVLMVIKRIKKLSMILKMKKASVR